jgi:hypothetical protein
LSNGIKTTEGLGLMCEYWCGLGDISTILVYTWDGCGSRGLVHFSIGCPAESDEVFVL